MSIGLQNSSIKGPAGKTFWESAGFGVAELAAEGVWVGAAIVIDHIPKRIMHCATSAIGKCIEPVLEPIEKGLSAVCKLEECQPDLTKSKQERARNLAKLLLVYAPGIYASWQVKFFVRRKLNKAFGVEDENPIPAPKGSSTFGIVKHYALLRDKSAEEKMIFIADEGMHLGSLFALNRPFARQTDSMINSTSNMIQKIFGISKDKAHEWGTAAWIWGVPNGIGALGGMLAIAGKHFGKWPKGSFGKFLGRE